MSLFWSMSSKIDGQGVVSVVKELYTDEREDSLMTQEQKGQDNTKDQQPQSEQERVEQYEHRPIQLTNDVIADTDLGEGAGNDLGTLSPDKAQEILQERLREQGTADPRKAMSTDRDPTTTRPDIDLGG
jgi:hypothetical protein